MSTRAVEIIEPGPLSTTQDLGRPGLMSMGVVRSGAADRSSLRLANRLVGNPEDAVAIEATFGGLTLRARGRLTVALTGAPAPAARNGLRVAHDSVLELGDGDELTLGHPRAGARTYVAVRGGLLAQRVLGSASTDLLSGLGPPPLARGAVLEVGDAEVRALVVDHAPMPRRVNDVIELPMSWGPREDWLTPSSRTRLLEADWTVTAASNRVGIRLSGDQLELRHDRELLSEGVALGAIQVPPQGQPILFLADHPVTGGYPVVAVVDDDAIDAAGQAVPGQTIRFRPSNASVVRRPGNRAPLAVPPTDSPR